MLTPPEYFEINPQPIGRPLVLGEPIGRRLVDAETEQAETQ